MGKDTTEMRASKAENCFGCSLGTPLITKAFLLIAISKKAAYFPLFVKRYFENCYKNLDSTFL